MVYSVEFTTAARDAAQGLSQRANKMVYSVEFTTERPTGVQ